MTLRVTAVTAEYLTYFSIPILTALRASDFLVPASKIISRFENAITISIKRRIIKNKTKTL